MHTVYPFPISTKFLNYPYFRKIYKLLLQFRSIYGFLFPPILTMIHLYNALYVLDAPDHWHKRTDDVRKLNRKTKPFSNTWSLGWTVFVPVPERYIARPERLSTPGRYEQIEDCAM